MRPLMEKTPAGVWHNVVGQLDRKVDEASAGAWEAATRFSRGAGSRRSSRRQASSSRDLAQATQSPAQRDRLGDQRIVQATRTGPSATLCRYALARGADPLVELWSPVCQRLRNLCLRHKLGRLRDSEMRHPPKFLPPRNDVQCAESGELWSAVLVAQRYVHLEGAPEELHDAKALVRAGVTFQVDSVCQGRTQAVQVWIM